MKLIENKSIWKVEPIYMPMVASMFVLPYQAIKAILSLLTFNKNTIKDNFVTLVGIAKGFIRLQMKDRIGQAMLSDLYIKGQYKEFYFYAGLSIILQSIMFYLTIEYLMFPPVLIILTLAYSEHSASKYMDELWGRDLAILMMKLKSNDNGIKQIGNKQDSLYVVPTSATYEWGMFLLTLIKGKFKYAKHHFVKTFRKLLFLEKGTRMVDYFASRADKLNKLTVFKYVYAINILAVIVTLLMRQIIPIEIANFIGIMLTYIYLIKPSYTLVELNKRYRGEVSNVFKFVE